MKTVNLAPSMYGRNGNRPVAELHRPQEFVVACAHATTVDPKPSRLRPGLARGPFLLGQPILQIPNILLQLLLADGGGFGNLGWRLGCFSFTTRRDLKLLGPDYGQSLMFVVECHVYYSPSSRSKAYCRSRGHRLKCFLSSLLATLGSALLGTLGVSVIALRRAIVLLWSLSSVPRKRSRPTTALSKAFRLVRGSRQRFQAVGLPLR